MKIYVYLKNNEGKNVNEITEYIGLRQPTVSYHLKEMYDSGLLKRDTKGKEVFYSVHNACPHDGELCIINHVEIRKS